ncbi:MAG TPA: TusE/DsrC/DsvC family sulfur relay protein [Parasulfuritortus sp.]
MMDINKLIRAENVAPCEADEFTADLEPWTEDQAKHMAHEEDLELSDEHMEVICWLRDHFAECGPAENGRMLSRAMEDNFAEQGGLKYLYHLFPRGPVYQGCRLAGLPLPPYSIDPSFGSTH